jgi:hypothetical protein
MLVSSCLKDSGISKNERKNYKKRSQIQDEKMSLTKDEVYKQISQSASLFEAILEHVEKIE